MLHHYKLDADNLISYHLLGDFVLVDFVTYTEPANLLDTIRTYFNYFAGLPNVSFWGSFPGTCNPLVVRANLDVVKEKGFSYRVFYAKEEIAAEDLARFERTVLYPHVNAANAQAKRGKQFACEADVGNGSNVNGFKQCSIFAPLKENTLPVRTPIKFYQMDAEGVLVAEFDEKPQTGENFFVATRLSDLFKLKKIKIADSKPKFFDL
jgi:hypothetical protein